MQSANEIRETPSQVWSDRFLRPSPTGAFYIPGLDGLRAFSVVIVIVAHCGFQRMVPGGFGVTSFFFISGFLITTLLLNEYRDSGAIRFGNFYLRRVARLSPELLAFIAITTILAAWQGTPPGPDMVAAGVFYLMNYYMLFIFDPGTVGPVAWNHLWSLAVEEHFYLTFPIFLGLLAGNWTRLARCLIAVLALGLTWRIVLVLAGARSDYIFMASDTRIDSIAYGCLLAVLMQYFPRLSPIFQRYGYAFLFAGVGLLLFSLVVRNPAFRDTLRYSLQGLGFAGVFIGLYGSPAGTRLLALLEAPPLRVIGRLSYAAYLWQFIAIHALEALFSISSLAALPLWQRAVFALAAVALTLVFAQISYVLVFQPLAGLRRRLAARSHQRLPAGP